MTPEIRALVQPGVDPARIEALAVEQGMRPLTQQALELARAGEIALSEVFRVRLN